METKTYRTFNSKNCISSGGNIPARISIGKVGLISINRKAITALKLKPEDKIEFVQEVNNPKNWYIRKDKEGFILQISKASKKSYNLKFNNIALVKEIYRSLDICKTVSILISTTPDEDGMYAILTSSIK